jgi:hypothetical protein
MKIQMNSLTIVGVYSEMMEVAAHVTQDVPSLRSGKGGYCTISFISYVWGFRV